MQNGCKYMYICVVVWLSIKLIDFIASMLCFMVAGHLWVAPSFRAMFTKIQFVVSGENYVLHKFDRILDY